LDVLQHHNGCNANLQGLVAMEDHGVELGLVLHKEHIDALNVVGQHVLLVAFYLVG
jgi:hypothetical protein